MSDKKIYDELATGDGTYRTTLNAMFRKRKPWSPANEKHLLSYIPGTVVAINVRAGSKVVKGQELMMYKAMKMDNRILSPVDGIVKSVNVKVGESLPKGALMVEFE